MNDGANRSNKRCLSRLSRIMLYVDGKRSLANPLVIFQAISYTEKEIVYPAQVMLRQKSGTCSQQTSTKSRRLFGISHSSGGHCQLSNGACGCRQEEKGATPGDDPWVGPLVQC